MIRKLSRLVFIFGLLAVVALSLLPQEHLPQTETWDKLNHFVAYAGLALAGGLGFKEGRSLLIVGLSLLILGTGLEFAQAALPSRSASAYDALANVVGVAFGCLAAASANCFAHKQPHLTG
jgi:VanZ family protein